MNTHYFSELIGQYGLYAVFVLVIFEGEITLLIAGVLAHNGFFGDYGYLWVLGVGMLAALVADNGSYLLARLSSRSLNRFAFYRVTQPRMRRISEKFGSLTIFLTKYIYGLRWATCIFYGVGRMRYSRFFLLTFSSCLVWVTIMTSGGYFFSGAISRIIGGFHDVGILLLVIVVVGIAGVYLMERFWLSRKVESADPHLIQEFEQAAQEKLQELSLGIQERIPFKTHLRRRPDSKAGKGHFGSHKPGHDQPLQ
jgi:membrane protein DedA with SNARE-associated domain